tara:strand:- start:1105 stop:1443 length:339 start_codon:yes stop_codon:yes gene_type:complete
MKYIILVTLIFSSSAFAFDSAHGSKNAHIDCLKSAKKVHLSQARSKNFPQSRVNENYYNCLDISKKVVKAPKESSPSEKVRTGAAVLLSPVGAAFWLIDKVVSIGVDKTINK